MSFTRVNPTSWSTGDQITDTHINTLDIDHANAVDGADGGSYTVSAPIIIGGSGIVSAGTIDIATNAIVDNVSSRFGTTWPITQTDITDQGGVSFWIPRMSTDLQLDGVFVMLEGAVAGHGALPANMPTLQVQRRELNSGDVSWTTSSVGSEITDASATVGAYESFHVLASTGLAHTFGSAYIYLARIKGESGANSATGLRIVRAWAEVIAA
jgi:hypothetical protein